MYLWISYTPSHNTPRQVDLQDAVGFLEQSQIFVRNQEEYDTLRGYELMYGKRLNLSIWNGHVKGGKNLKPFVLTTWKPEPEYWLGKRC